MINKNSILLSLMALVFCLPSAEAQEFSFGGSAGRSKRVAALNDQTIVQSFPRKAAVVVGKLPKDYFHSIPAQSPETRTSASYTIANMLVIAGLATMLCIGLTITGLCILRRRPHSTPAKILMSA